MSVVDFQKGFGTLLLFLFVLGCSEPPLDAQTIIDRARAAHGSDNLRYATIDFDFRDRHFTLLRNGGLFQYERLFTDSTGQVRDVLNNDGFYREVNGSRVELPEETWRGYETSVNSVAYFALLPFPLNDSAVRKTYLGEVALDGQAYHKVEVRFAQAGGGRDFDDWFIYWLHTETFTMDYLAYYFHVDGGGSRFRKAINPREVGGFRFQDYLNYTADTLGTAIERYDDPSATPDLELVSEILLENLTVRLLPEAERTP